MLCSIIPCPYSGFSLLWSFFQVILPMSYLSCSFLFHITSKSFQMDVMLLFISLLLLPLLPIPHEPECWFKNGPTLLVLVVLVLLFRIFHSLILLPVRDQNPCFVYSGCLYPRRKDQSLIVYHTWCWSRTRKSVHAGKKKEDKETWWMECTWGCVKWLFTALDVVVRYPPEIYLCSILFDRH